MPYYEANWNGICQYDGKYATLSQNTCQYIISDQLERAVKADQSGSQIWKERESQFQKQIRQLEDSIGSDAKDIQRLRLDLHQERMKNKRLALKLEETESLAQKPKEISDFPKREEPRSPIKEMDLNIKTTETGNR